MVKFVTVVAAFVGAAALAQPATAVPPTTSNFAATGSVTLGSGALCSFPIVVGGTQEWTTTTFYDQGGTVTERITNGTELDTFSANGKTLVGDRYHFNFVAQYENGVRVAYYSDGIAERVHLPDGSVFLVAGRVDATGMPIVLSVDSGNSGNNLAAFCGALS